MAETLKARICSLKMDDGEVLDVHKWVMLKYTDDGSVSVEIDYEAMRADGYRIVRQEETLEWRLRNTQQQMGLAAMLNDQRLQALQYQRMRPGPFGGLFGGSI